MSGNNLSGSTRYFDKYCANDKITSLGPNRSTETDISKNSWFQDDKFFFDRFSSNHRLSQTSGNNSMGSTSCSDNYFGTYEGIFFGPKRFEKRKTFQWWKDFELFSSYYRTWQMSANNIWESTNFFDEYCANHKIISLGPNKSIETNFSRNSCFRDDKCYWPTFHRIIECDKHQGTNDKGSQALPTITVELLKYFFKI